MLATLARDEEVFWRYAEDYLTPTVFSDPSHRRVFSSLVDWYTIGAQGTPVEVPRAEPLTEAELDAAVKRLVDLAQRRVAAEVVSRLWLDLRAGTQVQDVLAAAIEKLAEAQQAARIMAPGEGLMLTDLLVQLEKEYQEARVCMAATGRPTPHPTWGSELKSLTYITSGLVPKVWVIGGEPGTGKTSLATYMMYRYLRSDREACGMWVDTGENRPPSRWALWFACVAAGACFQKFERYIAPNPELRQVLEAVREYASRVAYMDVNPHTTIAHIRGAVRRLMARTGCKRCIVVVDYLQKLASITVTGKEDYKTKLESILASLTKLLDVAKGPVVIISSLTKDAWKNDIGLAGFKESGNIGQEADIAIIMRLTDDPRNQNVGSAVREIELHFAKNRQGVEGKVTVYADRIKSKFTEMDPGHILMPPELRTSGEDACGENVPL